MSVPPRGGAATKVHDVAAIVFGIAVTDNRLPCPAYRTSGPGFRPQPMGLCLNGHPANPVRCLFQGSGPDRTSTVLRLRPAASPFGPAFIVTVSLNDNEYSRGSGNP